MKKQIIKKGAAQKAENKTSNKPSANTRTPVKDTPAKQEQRTNTPNKNTNTNKTNNKGR